MEQYIPKSALVAEIERRINEINLDTIEDWRYRLQREHDIEVMKNILSLIDTLEVKEVQEEPVSIWHDASEEPNGDNSIVIAYDNGCTVEPSFKDFKSYSEWGTIKKSYRVKQWAYVNDVLNLTNKEEPVSDECIYNRTLEEKQKSCKFCSAACQVRIKEEPVSEEWIEELRAKLDSMSKEEFEQVWGKYKVEEEEPVSEELEEAAEGYAVTDEVLPNGKVMINFQVEKAFRAGAKWQKQQDQSIIELAEDHAMLAGMEKMKQQLMAKAITAHCFGFQGDALFSFRLPSDKYLVGSEVKVIVIKED